MKILVSALEPSANLHLKALISHCPEVELNGIFDPRLGVPCYSSHEFNVMGFASVIPKLALIRRALNVMVESVKECDKVLLIDAPSFNLPLAKAIKKRYPNKPIYYYILPKVWAWKKGRIQEIEKYCDYLGYIFPFEKEFWKKGSYVGNPLLDEMDLVSTIHPESVVFMPGSRKAEIKALMPLFREVALGIREPKILVVPPHLKESISSVYGDVSLFELSFATDEALSKAMFVFACSGTATLECALKGIPLALVYKTSWWEYAIAKHFVKLSHVGLANILADFAKHEEIHSEFLQEQANAKTLLASFAQREFMKAQTQSQWLKQHLGHGSSHCMAQWLMNDSPM